MRGSRLTLLASTSSVSCSEAWGVSLVIGSEDPPEAVTFTTMESNEAIWRDGE